MDHADYEQYFNYLRNRKKLKQALFNIFIYPRICRHLTGRVLDIGCGIGDFITYRKNTVGIDVNPFNVKYCNEHNHEAHLVEGTDYPFADNAFDGAVMDNVLEHIDNPAPVIEEVQRVLKPGGSLVIGVPGIRGYKADIDHKRYYDDRMLAEYMESRGMKTKAFAYSPFFIKSDILSRKLRQYCVYGVFTQAP